MKETNNIELHNSIKEMLVKDLRLKVSPQDIKSDTPLFGEGLGLDSIDAMELVIALEKTFGVRVPDAKVGAKVLVNVNSIADFIEEKKLESADGQGNQ